MSPLYRTAPEFAKPMPRDMFTAEAGVSTVAWAAWSATRTAAREAPPELVTAHPPPWRQLGVDTLTGASARFASKARAAGHEVAARRAGACVCVGVRTPRVRAYWTAGRSSGVILDGRRVSVAAAVAAL